MERAAFATFAAYALIGIITFGHAAANTTAPECEIFCITSREEKAVIGGMGAAIMWPLYWSWEVFEAGKGRTTP